MKKCSLLTLFLSILVSSLSYRLYDQVTDKDLTVIYQNLNEIFNELEDSSYEASPLKRFSKSYNSNQNNRDIIEPISEGNEIEKISKIPQNGELFEEDIIMDARLRNAVNNKFLSKKSAIVSEDIKWDNGVLPYVIDESLKPCAYNLLMEAIEEFKKRTCIKLVPRTNESDYVIYTSEEDTCSSHIGRQGGPQKIFIGESCCVLGTVEHETMHSLGFIHEHSRPDRDDFIKVEFANIKEEDFVNFEKYSFANVNDENVDYNFNSVMHYRGDAFTKNGKNTIVPRYPEPSDNFQFGQRVKFSEGDITQIVRFYDCRVTKESYAGLFHDYSGYKFEKEKKRRDSVNRSRNELLRKLYSFQNLSI
nr:unnamed protein product [Hydra vulgaris]